MANGLESLIVPAYERAWDVFSTRRATELWLKGGRGSIKSTFAAYAVVAGVMANPGVNAMVVRKHLTDVRGSVYNQIAWAIEKLDETFPGLDILSRWRFRQNPADMTFDGERAIVFHGLDDPRKRKSVKPKHGYFGYLWFEELDEFAGVNEISSLKKSVLRGGPIGQTIFTFNPPMSKTSWVNTEAIRRKPGRYVFHTSYLDVIGHHPEWLGDTFINDAEDLRLTNERQYRYELLGEAVGDGGEIFQNVKAVRFTDEDIENFRAKRWGMDFGQIDPTVLTGSYYDRNTNRLKIFDEFYKSDVYTWDIMKAIDERGLRNTVIIGDPGGGGKTVVKDLRGAGARYIREAYKPAGSVEKGVRWLRELAGIDIDSQRCPHAWNEFYQYGYDRLRDGTWRNEFPDRDNHTIDSIRYAHEEEIFKGERTRLLGY